MCFVCAFCFSSQLLCSVRVPSTGLSHSQRKRVFVCKYTQRFVCTMQANCLFAGRCVFVCVSLLHFAAIVAIIWLNGS